MDREKKIFTFIELTIQVQKYISTSKTSLLARYGFNKQQIDVLYMLDVHKKINMKDIAHMANTTPGAATQIIDGLVKQGIIERKSDNDDRRVIHIALTAEGEALFKKFKKDHIAYTQELLSGLTDEELETFITIENKLLKKVMSLYDK